MSEGKPRRPHDGDYQLIREGHFEEFNRRRSTAQACDLRGCDLRGMDLTKFDMAKLDLSDCYLRQADLRGLDLRTCRLAGASLHAAHVSGGTGCGRDRDVGPARHTIALPLSRRTVTPLTRSQRRRAAASRARVYPATQPSTP